MKRCLRMLKILFFAVYIGAAAGTWHPGQLARRHIPLLYALVCFPFGFFFLKDLMAGFALAITGFLIGSAAVFLESERRKHVQPE